jgi:hypothetical protein
MDMYVNYFYLFSDAFCTEVHIECQPEIFMESYKCRSWYQSKQQQTVDMVLAKY